MEMCERDNPFLKSLLPGESLLLRADKLQHMQTGKWNFFWKVGNGESYFASSQEQ
jgi:hypothetical protein